MNEQMMIGKERIYEYLTQHNIWHEITEHKAVWNMAEAAEKCDKWACKRCIGCRFYKAVLQ